VPAALALMIAGGAAARGVLQAPNAFGAALLAMLAGDTLMFLLGRYTGWWLLGILCRISLNPESCILRSAILSIAAAGRCSSSPSSFQASTPWRRRSPEV